MTTNNAKMTKAQAAQCIGCAVNYRGNEATIEDMRHMGAGGWMARLSTGAIIRLSELR